MADKNLEGDLNLLRKNMDKVLISYNSIIDLEDGEEFKYLGNDLMTVFRAFLDQVVVN